MMCCSDGPPGSGGGTIRPEAFCAGTPGAGGPGLAPSLLLGTMPLMGTERSLAEIDETMRARGYRHAPELPKHIALGEVLG